MIGIRRVAITGLGIISAVGTGRSEFFASLLAARSGIRAIELVFPAGPESVLAGTIDFNPDDHFSKARLLTMDRVSQLALVAARRLRPPLREPLAPPYDNGLANPKACERPLC